MALRVGSSLPAPVWWCRCKAGTLEWSKMLGIDLGVAPDKLYADIRREVGEA